MDRRSKLAVRSVLSDEARPSVETPCPRANRTRLTVGRFIAVVADKFKHPTAVDLKAYHGETGGCELGSFYLLTGREKRSLTC
jgi:hypothetical protein